ncbi:MAG: WD40/YVTN/BNR-like repeat-containing protein [Spirochaetales bacterium]
MEEYANEVAIATARGLWRVDQTQPIAFDEKHVRGLALDNESLYAIVGRHEVWSAPRQIIRDTDPERQGDAWKMLARLDEQLWSLFPTQNELLIGTEGAHLYRLAEGSSPVLDRSFEENPDRPNWLTPWGGPPAVRSMSMDAGDALYVNVHVGGIHKQESGGTSWNQLIDIDFDVHQVVCSQALLFAPGGKGFAQRPISSTEGAETWEKTTSGLDFHYMRAVAVSDSTLLVSASDGPHGDRGAVYSRPLGSDEPFRKCCVGLPQWFGGNVDTFCLVADGPTVAIGSPGGYVFVSQDSGDVWTEVARDLPEINAVALL